MTDAQENVPPQTGKPKIIGLWWTAFLSLCVGGGSMKVWIDQYGGMTGFFLGIATGVALFAIGLTFGYLAGRVPKH